MPMAFQYGLPGKLAVMINFNYYQSVGDAATFGSALRLVARDSLNLCK